MEPKYKVMALLGVASYVFGLCFLVIETGVFLSPGELINFPFLDVLILLSGVLLLGVIFSSRRKNEKEK